MFEHTRLGGIGAGLLVAFAAGCTQYIGANEPEPQILGVTVASAYSAFTQPAPGWCSVSFETCSFAGQDCSGYCSTATLEKCFLDGDCGGSCSSTKTWGCANAADCPGFCVVDATRGCKIDDDCAPGDSCRTTLPGVCSVDGAVCYRNTGPTGLGCAQSPAAQICSLPGHCSTTTATPCNTLKHCSGAPTQTCTKDSDCTSPQTCRVVECPGTETCVATPSQTCNPTPQTCVGRHGFCSFTTGVSCLADGDCPGHCSATTTTPCLTDAGCATGQTCVPPPSQTCTLPGTCSTTTTTPCAVNSQCPAGETCNNATAPGGLQTCNYTEDGSAAGSYNWPYPPREGPVFEYNFTGGSVPPQATWSLGVASSNPGFNLPGGVPSGPWPSPRYGPYLFARPRLVFNKLLDGPSIQADPTACGAGPLTVTATPAGGPTADVTADFGVCYDPSSPTTAYGAGVFLMPASGRLRSDTTYRITGSILDKQARPTTVDFTIKTAP